MSCDVDEDFWGAALRFYSFACLTSLGLALLPVLGFGNTEFTVYPKQLLQRIDGFGASDAWYAPEIHSFTASTQSKILDALFSTTNGAGLSLLRHRVPYEIEPSPGVWDWTQDNDAVWLSQQAVARGVSQVWSTVWSPPAWMKTNNNVDNGGQVATSHYQDYATFLSTYVQHYTTSFGVKISGISIANEPDQTQPYESSNWSAQQFHDFIADNLLPTFQSAGIKAQVIMPEFSGWSDALASTTLADPITADFVGIIASHDYWMGLGPFTDALAAEKTIWETEVSNLGTDDPSINDGISWAETIQSTLLTGQVNAWHYWWLYSNVGDTTGQSLISGDPSKDSFTVKKRLWTIGNFSRFVRPGSHMVEVSSNNPMAGVYVTAFISTNGSVSIVAINSNNIAENLIAKTEQPALVKALEYRTSATENLNLVRIIPVSPNGFVANLAARSVSTFYLPSTH